MNWHSVADGVVVAASLALAMVWAEQVPVDVGSIIVAYGPMAGMLIWFMWRWEKLIARLLDSHDRLARSVWASIVTRAHHGETNDAIVDEARKELDRMNEGKV